MMTRKLQIAALLASLALGTTAWAGYRYTAEVQIDVAHRTARGALGAARASVDPYQAIGCRIGASPGGDPVLYCFATDATNYTATCSSKSGSILTVASMIRDSSFISFGWDAGGACTSLNVENYSSHLPPQP
jgi:hypothetical protein